MQPRGVVSLSTLPTGAGDFACLARHLMLNGEHIADLAAMAEGMKGTPGRLPERVTRVIEKAAQGALDLGGSLSALGDLDLQNIAAAFMPTLATAGAFDRILTDGAFFRAPVRTRLLGATARLSATALDEGQAAPLVLNTLTGAVLDPLRAGAIIVLTQEILRAGGNALEAFISSELRAALAGATDAKFLAVVGDAVSTAGSLASSGSDFDAIAADVGALLGALALGSASRPYLLISPAAARRMMTLVNSLGVLAFPGMTLTGGTVCNVTAIATDAVDDGDVFALDASGIAADSGGVTLDTSREAALELATNPANNSGTPTESAANMVSLFQTNSAALKVNRLFGVKPVRDGAVAEMTGATWGVAASGA